MLRWFINIFIAIVVTGLVMILLRIFLVGPVSLEIPVTLIVTLILIAAGAGVLAWATGLTRLNLFNKRQHSSLILAYLEQAVRLNLPLPQMLLAAQETERGSLSRKINLLRDLLAKGISITDAVRVAVPGTPARSLGLLGAAERVGRIGSELNRLVRDQQRPADQNLSEQSLIRSYPFFMSVAIVFAVSMLMIFVIPKYVRILLDFKVEIPDITRMVINVARVFAENGWLQLLILLTIAGTIIQKVRLSVGNNKRAIWFTTSRQYADVCQVIADALEAGEPLDSAIQAASHLAIAALLRRKLRRWVDGIEQGIPAAQAATNAHMPKLMVGLTGTSHIGGGQVGSGQIDGGQVAAAEAFRFLSRYYAAKFSRTMMLLHAAIIPGMVFFFGFIVAIVALAMFLPLVVMIGSVSGCGGRL